MAFAAQHGEATTASLLNAAATNDQLEMVRELLKRRRERVDLPNSHGSTALMAAAHFRHLPGSCSSCAALGQPKLADQMGMGSLFQLS